jgi:hypothetical protein
MNFVYSNWYNIKRTFVLFYFIALFMVYFFYSPGDDFGEKTLVQEDRNSIDQDNLVNEEVPSKESKVSKKKRVLQ